jgi:hypothetical protein
MIACPPVIVTGVSEMLKEPQDAFERERVEGDLREPARHIGCDEGEKQPQSVSMRLDRGRPETLLEGEFVGQERVEQAS